MMSTKLITVKKQLQYKKGIGSQFHDCCMIVPTTGDNITLEDNRTEGSVTEWE